MQGYSFTRGLVEIGTQWIDEDGNDVDLASRFGRLGSDVADFAVHTMGWVRCTSVGTFKEYGFDARSAKLGALSELLRRLTSETVIGDDDRRLCCVEVTTTFGTTRIADDRPGRLVSLVTKCMEMADPSSPRDSINRSRLSMQDLPTLNDRVANQLIAAWRENGGVFSNDVADLVNNERLQRSLKVMVPHGDTFRFVTYSGSPNAPWDRATWRGFAGGSIDQVVPDRGMIESVKASTRAALDLKEPVLELCEGVVLASDGLKEFSWYRISIPVDLPPSVAGSSDKAVIALLAPRPRLNSAA